MKMLEGKVALITGAARGIGKAIALKYAAEGADIAFTDLVIDDNGKQTEQEISALGWRENFTIYDESDKIALIKESGRELKMTADALGVPVLCGPTEGACAGNVLVQMIALGDLKDHAEARELMRVSDPPIAYEPDPASASAWADALARFGKMRNA